MNKIREILSKAEKNARDAIKPYPARAERFEPYSQSGPLRAVPLLDGPNITWVDSVPGEGSGEVTAGGREGSLPFF